MVGRPFPLPVRKVCILNGKVRQWRGLARRKGFVKCRQFGEENPVSGCRVGDDLMNSHVKAMPLIVHAYQQGTHQWTRFQVEWTLCILRCQTHRFRLALCFRKLA